MNIPIPDLFACMNGKKMWNAWNYTAHYKSLTKEGGAANTCIECGACEEICPQHLSIRELLKETSQAFDNIDW
jgi:predicted aldo/keto reductase-like oxidoreductase